MAIYTPGRAAWERKERSPASPAPGPRASGLQTEGKPVSVVPAARLRCLDAAARAGWRNPRALSAFSLPIFVGGAGVDSIPWSVVGGITGGGLTGVGNGASLSWPLNTSVGRTGFLVT